MGLSLDCAIHVTADAGNPPGYDRELLDYHRDLLAPYGIPVREDLLADGRNVSFTELAEQLIAQAALEPRARPDLLILAHALPDYHPLTTVSAHANHLLGGRARSLAVSGQGLRSPFTALRLASAYARSGRATRLALFILEQTTLPYAAPAMTHMPEVDSGVLLVLGSGGAWAARAAAPVRADRLGTVIRQAVAGLPEDRVLLVAGPRTDPARIEACALPSVRVGPGSYCTSVWLDLARHWPAWSAEYDAVVLCDTDPDSGRSCVAWLSRHADAGPDPAADHLRGSRTR
ncbi:hypothetical protein KGQ20_08015 [Catenulispora sp. NF23]|uniref:Uncharacterized protein n=1 Tax=Catenulispora pinistramenti TaxID=2705254 RepID=A0ABS5KPD9_9ACTN|nr:hypothetical protein [Catenulispora pinistramenti]MBS2532717.1 hypothetical protein [Catenulispora pinistramenti]MBS2547866.1 hypothetical protein [Catenulispora pinistramenti]